MNQKLTTLCLSYITIIFNYTVHNFYGTELKTLIISKDLVMCVYQTSCILCCRTMPVQISKTLARIHCTCIDGKMYMKFCQTLDFVASSSETASFKHLYIKMV